MKIAVFVKGTIFHKNYGGLETQNQILCEGLVAKGFEIHIFAPKKDVVDTVKTQNNITYHFVESKFKLGMFFGFFGDLDKNNWVNKSYQAFLEQNEGEKFNIVISQSTAGIGILRKKNNHNFKSIMVAHGSIISEYKTFIMEFSPLSFKQWFLLVKNTAFVLRNFFTRQRETVHLSDKVVAVSTFVKEKLIEETFAPEDKFAVINNGVLDVNTDLTAKNYSKKLLYVGRLEKSKGIDILLNALAKIKTVHPDVILQIAGSGPYKQELQDLTVKLNLQDNVIFAGWLEKQQLADLYFDSSIFVLPTIRIEGFPMTLAEASSYGLALVVSDIGGNSDAVKNKSGYLVKPNNTQELADLLSNLLSDLSMAKNLGKLAQENFKQNFTRDIMLDKYCKIIEEL